MTIGNHFLRIYTNTLAKKISDVVPLNTRQKGFIKARGCFENMYTLWIIIRQAKESRTQLSVVFIDLAMELVGIPRGMSNIVTKSGAESTVRKGVLTR